MIEILYRRGEVLCLEVRGHAGAGAPGQDPVCAGVSALVLTLAENVRRQVRRGNAEKPQIRLERGFARVACQPVTDAAPAVYDTVVAGLALLGRLYPSYIKEVNYG